VLTCRGEDLVVDGKGWTNKEKSTRVSREELRKWCWQCRKEGTRGKHNEGQTKRPKDAHGQKVQRESLGGKKKKKVKVAHLRPEEKSIRRKRENLRLLKSQRKKQNRMRHFRQIIGLTERKKFFQAHNREDTSAEITVNQISGKIQKGGRNNQPGERSTRKMGRERKGGGKKRVPIREEKEKNRKEKSTGGKKKKKTDKKKKGRRSRKRRTERVQRSWERSALEKKEGFQGSQKAGSRN